MEAAKAALGILQQIEGDEMPKRKRSWMTASGATVTGIGGFLAGLAQVIPKPTWKPWLECAAFVCSAGIGPALMGQGIRRRLPDAD